VRARVRRHVWSLLALRPGGFPWLSIAGKRLHRWVVIDMDAMIITAGSKKEGAAATWNPTPPQRHAKDSPNTACDMSGRQPLTTTPSARRRIEAGARR
jgi:hypothetical protein